MIPVTDPVTPAGAVAQTLSAAIDIANALGVSLTDLVEGVE
jgi:hypothetical protein